MEATPTPDENAAEETPPPVGAAETASGSPPHEPSSWWRGAVQSILGGIVAGVAASLILDAFGAYRQQQRDQATYDAIRGQIATAAEKFRLQTLDFAGLGEEGRFSRNNIYRVPVFPFALCDVVERNESVFIDREGEPFIGVLASFGQMRDVYAEIVTKRQGSRGDGRLDWDTKTWKQYFRPACAVCDWAGVPIDDIEPDNRLQTYGGSNRVAPVR